VNTHLATLDVTCKHASSCGWEGALDELEGHLTLDCPREGVTCKWPGCGERWVRAHIDWHEASQCLHRLVRCPHGACGAVTKRPLLAVHEAGCAHAPVPCPNRGCGEQPARGELTRHRKGCMFQITDCPVHGCDARLARHAIDAHLAADGVFHVKRVCGQLAAAQQAASEAGERLDEADARADAAEERADAAHKRANAAEARLAALERDVRALRSAVAAAAAAAVVVANAAGAAAAPPAPRAGQRRRREPAAAAAASEEDEEEEEPPPRRSRRGAAQRGSGTSAAGASGQQGGGAAAGLPMNARCPLTGQGVLELLEPVRCAPPSDIWLETDAALSRALSHTRVTPFRAPLCFRAQRQQGVCVRKGGHCEVARAEDQGRRGARRAVAQRMCAALRSAARQQGLMRPAAQARIHAALAELTCLLHAQARTTRSRWRSWRPRGGCCARSGGGSRRRRR
jgi:hypothetical protein